MSSSRESAVQPVSDDVRVPAEPVNGFALLDKVASLPVSTWRYQWEDPEVRHLGPMAQDWKATFELGETDTMIAGVDANGVAMVSIQALYRLVQELQTEVATLRNQLAAQPIGG